MNRIIHRIGAFLAVLLMLWLAGTGSTIQVLDLKAAMSNASPDTDVTALSMAEGMYGPNNFAVIQLSDFSAAALPEDFDINQGVGKVLQAARASQSQDVEADSRGNNPTWVELRVVNGVPVGQVMKGGKLTAFNAQSGEAVSAVQPQPIPQGARLPPSLRQKLKTLHRFWNRGDVPGVYFEFLSGLVLMTLLITGLVLYFQLLKARAKAGRLQLFWFTGGMWRGLHRAVSVVAGAFLLCMAFSGTWIGYESSWSALHRGGGGAPPAAAGQPGQQGMDAGGMGPGGPRNQNAPLRENEIPALTATTVRAMQQLHPDLPIKAIRLRTFGQMKQGVVIVGGAKTDQLVFNAETGQPASLTEPEYPRSNFPFGVQTHENIKHFHSGEMFGVSGQFMNLFGGLSLLFLSVSGLVVYFDLWAKRKKLGRKGLLWTR